MTTSLKIARLIFAGGGTGGHLYPAIAIADRVTELLRDKMKVEIIFVGTKRGLEYQLRDTLKYPLHIINVMGIARRLTLKNLLVPFILIGALISSSRLLKQFAPNVVVGTGGYVCWPIVRVASAKGIPAVLQEQNSFPGITTRRLAPLARTIYLGFAGAKEHLRTRATLVVTGNPVRRTISTGDRGEALRYFKLDPSKSTILILGGSQGARAINHAVLRSLANLASNDKIQLLWQTGKRDYTEVIAKAGDKAQAHALFPFENHMELVYAAADVAIARAGAIALAEIEACAVPSILIPYPSAAGDHQRKNAEEFARQGFAAVIDEKDLEKTDIVQAARELLQTGKAKQMRSSIRTSTADRKPAVDVIAEDIISIISGMESTGEEA
jgi:UDP-N-acetylglucosamine--N-acetylmuramyl-(pentapeptide) pyrophosphoryl-undecaprenol N-acetylglucosamine transferase